MNKEFAQAFAVTFTDMYIESGVARAAQFLGDQKITEEVATELAPYIREEFIKRGYTFED